MKICIAGKNNIAVDILLHALSLHHKNDIFVIINKTETYKNTWQKSLGFYARLNNIQIVKIEDVLEIEELVFFSLEFDKIINPQNFRSKKLYNIHFSYLPEYKGVFTSFLPILHGKKTSGITIHKIEAGIDTGEIIAQKKFNISGFTSADLYNKYLKEGVKIIKKNFESLIKGEITSKRQSLLNSTYFSKKSFNFNNTEIDLFQTGNQICAFVKSLYFRPFQLATYMGFKIYKAELFQFNSGQRVGSILEDNKENFEIQAIDCSVKLYKDYYDNLVEAIIAEDVIKTNYYSKLVHAINEYDKNGWNPMIQACYTGNVDIVKCIYNFGGNLNAKNLNGTTTLMYAKSAYELKKDKALLIFLLESGINVRSKDIFGKTVLDYTDDKDLIKLFKKYV